MAQHVIESQWMGKMQFNALVNGHTVIMDGPEKVGGEDNGPIPKPFVLTALSGCTGMDIVSLLRKQKIELKDFNIVVSGELSKQVPIEYISMHIVYDMKGDEADKAASIEAVRQSQEVYCGVSHMLKKALPITWEIHFNDHTVFNNQPMTAAAAS